MGTGSVTGLDEALLPGMIGSSASTAVKATRMKAESGLGTHWSLGKHEVGIRGLGRVDIERDLIRIEIDNLGSALPK